ERAREAYRRLCIETPIPHALKLWGAAALISDHAAEAQRAFTQLLAGAPADAVGWVGLWLSASEAGDTLTAAGAERHALAWTTDSREMGEVVEFFDHYPMLYAILQRRLPARPRGPAR